MPTYQIKVDDSPDKDNFIVVILIDDKTKDTASFALPKYEKLGRQTQLIKSAIYKITHKIWKLLPQTPKPKKKKKKSKPKKI